MSNDHGGIGSFEPSSFERGVLGAIVVFRWVAWLWLAFVVVVSRSFLVRTFTAAALVGIALAVTVATSALVRGSSPRRASRARQLGASPPASLRRRAVLVELAVGAALLAADPWVYDEGRSQSLGSAWPVAGLLAAGTVFGPLRGSLAGLALGAAKVAGTISAGRPIDSLLGAVSTAVLYALAGGVAGYAVDLLRDAEDRVSAARAREEIARRLHDGVLQTLAVVQRRSEDRELAELARDQERDLRLFLFGDEQAQTDLPRALRAAAARFEKVFGGRVSLVIADDLAPLAPSIVEALVGAVTEALNNAGKHGAAGSVTVFAEPTDDDGVFCSVKDDGSGFDPAAVTENVGLSRSIRARVGEVGGRVELDARPGRGAEVRLWLPGSVPAERRR